MTFKACFGQFAAAERGQALRSLAAAAIAWAALGDAVTSAAQTATPQYDPHSSRVLTVQLSSWVGGDESASYRACIRVRGFVTLPAAEGVSAQIQRQRAKSLGCRLMGRARADRQVTASDPDGLRARWSVNEIAQPLALITRELVSTRRDFDTNLVAKVTPSDLEDRLRQTLSIPGLGGIGVEITLEERRLFQKWKSLGYVVLTPDQSGAPTHKWVEGQTSESGTWLVRSADTGAQGWLNILLQWERAT